MVEEDDNIISNGFKTFLWDVDEDLQYEENSYSKVT